MQFFELKNFSIDKERHIDAINQNKDLFLPVKMFNGESPNVDYVGSQQWSYYHPQADDVVEECCKVLNIDQSLITLQTYLIVPPYMNTWIHYDEDRRCVLAIELNQVGGAIEWYDTDHNIINSHQYQNPCVINVRDYHRGKGGTDYRYQIQLNFDFKLSIKDVFDFYTKSPYYIQ